MQHLTNATMSLCVLATYQKENIQGPVIHLTLRQLIVLMSGLVFHFCISKFLGLIAGR
jgi:LytS/YehU family sensor histidine kinase